MEILFLKLAATIFWPGLIALPKNTTLPSVGKHLQKGNSGLMLMSIVLQWVSINYCDVDSLR